MVYLLLFLLVVIFVVAAVYVAFVGESLLNHRADRIIYHGSNLGEQGKVLEEIVQKYVPNPEKITLLEPGAGLGKVAEYLGRRYRWKGVQALEIGPVILWLGKVRAWLRHSPVHFVRTDIFTYPFPKPALIYCYLTTPMLDKLEAQGKLKGRLVISLTFPLTKIEPTQRYALKGWQKEVLVYDLRHG